MKQTIETPWSVGDIGWAILSRTENKHSTCDSCGHRSDDSEYVSKVYECQIDRISINVDKEGITYWYTCGFDIGDTKYDTKFTYGSNSIKNVYATREEAEAALKEDES